MNIRSTAFALIFVWLCWYGFTWCYNSPLLPGPSEVLGELRWPILWQLGWHGGISLYRVIAGLIPGFLVGTALGIFTGRSPRFDAGFAPIIFLTGPFPKIVLVPTLLLLVGVGDASKILLTAIIVFYQTVVSARDATLNLDRRYFDSFHSLGGRELDLWQHVVLPAILPQLLTGIRISLGTAFATLFFAETYATEYGLGYYIWDSFARFDYVGVYHGSLALCALGFILYAGITKVEERALRWRKC